jgi:hypothetical protein
MAKVNQPFDIGEIAERVEQLRIPSDKGTASFRTAGPFPLDDLVVVLESAIEFDETVPETQHHLLLTQAVFRAAESGSIDRGRLLEAINRVEREFLDTAPTAYVLLSTLSFEYFPALRPVRFRGAAVTFAPNRC